MLYTAGILFGDCGRNAERNQKPREHNIRSTSRIVLLRSLNRNIVSRYISVDSFFSMISPFSPPCHCVFFAFFLLRTRTTVTVIAAATTRTQTTRMTAYPQIGMMNATPGIQTMNVPVLSVVILT